MSSVRWKSLATHVTCSSAAVIRFGHVRGAKKSKGKNPTRTNQPIETIETVLPYRDNATHWIDRNVFMLETGILNTRVSRVL